MNERAAIELLRKKLAKMGEVAIFPQVGDGTGTKKVRTADAIMMGLWPSRGLHLTGIEYKRTRQDLKKELDDPSKADSIGKYCHYWLILAPAGLVNPMELPIPWGLWEIDDRERLLRTKAPVMNEHVEPVSYTFLAGLLRAAESSFRTDAFTAEMREATFKSGRAAGQREAKYDLENTKQKLAKLQEKVSEFEEASGISISSSYDGERLGKQVLEAVRLLADPDAYNWKLKSLRQTSRELYEASEDLAKLLEPSKGADA